MASSQVEIASNSAFLCVSSNSNRKEGCRESNVRSMLEQNWSEIVRDHIQRCISFSSDKKSQNQLTNRASSCTSNHEDNLKSHEPLDPFPKHCSVLDRWVTRQAQDVAAFAIKKHVNVNQVEPASLKTSNTSISKTKFAQNSSSGQASSLKKIWEARVHCSNSMNSNHNHSLSPNSSKTSSSLSSDENNNSPSHEKFDNETKNEDSLTDWESQSDATWCSRSVDNEKSSVADIIKRLANSIEDGHGNGRDQRNNTGERRRRQWHSCSPPKSNQAEQRGLSQIIKAPLLRGRQAFNDFVAQIERDRINELCWLAERQAVSKFSHRARLQSMLRLRSFQGSLTNVDKYCHPQPAGAKMNRLPQESSTIMHLREKFNSGGEHLMTAQNVPACPMCLHRQVSNNLVQQNKSSAIKPQTQDTQEQKDSSAERKNTNIEQFHQQNKPSSHAIQLKTRSESRCTESPETTESITSLEGRSVKEKNRNEQIHVQTKPPSNKFESICNESLETADSTTSLKGQSENATAKNNASYSQPHHCLDSLEMVDIISSLNTRNEITPEKDNFLPYLYLDLQETIETTKSLNGCTENKIGEEHDFGEQQHLYLNSLDILPIATSCDYHDDENEENEELEDPYEQYFTQENYDWFSNISRPKSYWEGLRQAWYQEVFSTTSENEEIRQLLERGRVSAVLASDMRDRMDRLLSSHVQMQEVYGAESEDNNEERMNQMKSFLQKDLHPEGGCEYKGQEQEVEVEDQGQGEDGITMSRSKTLPHSWSFQEDIDICNDSDHQPPSPSPSPPGPSEPNNNDHHTPYSSSRNHHSPTPEMQLIYDLRGQIAQIHHEMAELRKSVLSCIDMQVELHQSFNPKVHSVGGQGMNSAERAPSPWNYNNCCICYETQVDSLLYRCGHICTCLKCAQELQWRDGKCPTCGAPIQDVVALHMPPQLNINSAINHRRVLAPEDRYNALSIL